MPFTAAPTQAEPTSTLYSTPSHSDLAAVAATVSIVGVLMAVLIIWLAVRLRHSRPNPTSTPAVSRRPTSRISLAFRPSFAPSEASSKFGFTRKSFHLTHRHQNSSWDFVDPDPVSHSVEGPLDPPVRMPSQKHRPAPLAPIPAYTPRAHRASAHKDEWIPRTPTTPGTPASADCVEPPPPAYYRESTPQWLPYHPKNLSTS